MWQELLDYIQFRIQSINWTFNWLDTIEVLFVTSIIFVFYTKFIKNTQSEKLVKGLVFLFVAWIFAEILVAIGLNIVGMFLKGKPYIQYGIGLQKRWGDRFTGFAQAMIRNGGRNGIALQAGFRWALGKAPEKNARLDEMKKSSGVPELQSAKLNLQALNK